MQVFGLLSGSFVPLTANYSFDKNLKIDSNIVYTENTVNFSFANLFKEANDTATNNYSNLYLSKKAGLNDYVTLEPLDPLPDEGFSTYLAANALNFITPLSRFWVVQEPDIGVNVANVAVSGTYEKIDNRYFVEIVFINDVLCKIAHENNGVKRYLTIDYTGNLSFVKDAGTDGLGIYSPQIFLYIYDRSNEFIVLQKNINDIIKYVTYNPDLAAITLVDTLTGSTQAYGNNSIFRCVARNEAPNSTLLVDPWVAYQKNLKNNSLPVNPDLSYADTKDNFLVNNEYFTISGNTLNVNLLSLKNTNTPENYQSRNNPFFDEERVNMRDYKSLFTGSNQTLGNDNVTTNYESYTSNITFKKDKVTYFHIPQNFYPFKRLNINDSGLIEAGAIAGDHPLKADKVFKKKADYKATSYFGDTAEETSGDFLCAWLSGSIDPTVKPTWVDRYYNPDKTSYINALTSATFNAIEYNSVFECFLSEVQQRAGDVAVFDVPSSVMFEAGTYYAYQHIGPEFSNNFLKSLTAKLVQKDLDTYKNVNGADLENNGIYTFNKTSYAITNNLSAIQDSNNFTVIFDAYNSDWTRPFAYQLLGNYSNDGFGVYNVNYLTPTIFMFAGSALNITNLNFDTLHTVEMPASATAIIRREGFNDYFVLFTDGTFTKYNNNNVQVYAFNTPALASIVDYDHDEDNAYFLVNTHPGRLLYQVYLDTGRVEDVTATINYERYLTSLSNATTLNVYDDTLYLTGGSKARRIGTDIYFKIGTNAVYKWENILNVANKNVTQVFASSTQINSFNIDMDGNIWLLYSNNQFAKFNSSHVFQISGYIPNLSGVGLDIDFTYELDNNNGLDSHAIVYAMSSVASKNVAFYKYNSYGTLVSTFNYYNLSAVTLPLINTDFLREYVRDLYPDANLNFKLKFVNAFNPFDVSYLNMVYNLSAVDPGWHNFVFRVDTYYGNAYFLIDNQIVGYQEFAPRKYGFSGIIERPFFVGTSPYSNSIPLFEYIKDNDFNTRNISIKNFYLYSDALNYFDIAFHAKANSANIQDLIFDMACGRRNYLEEIERYFKFQIPGNKSTLMNIVLKNSGITNKDLRFEIEKRIYTLLAKTVPAYIKVNNIKWSN